MRSKLQKYKQFVWALCVLFVFMSIALISEKQKTSALLKQLQKKDTIVAPYYENDVFLPPKKSGETTGEQLKIPIIMYHYVEYVKDDGDLIRRQLNIAPSLFEGHLQALKQAQYETYFVRDVPSILNDTVSYSTHSAILTFDDGYEDFYTVVFPLLKKYHMRATVYVIYDYIGRSGFLSEKQIQELSESDLVEIGSHTLDHVYLKQAPDLYAEKQIIESKRLFEEKFHMKIKTFAYPYGAFNSKNVESVKKAGYTAAVSVISGEMQSKDTLFYLSRIRPGLFTPKTMIQTIEQIHK